MKTVEDYKVREDAQQEQTESPEDETITFKEEVNDNVVITKAPSLVRNHIIAVNTGV